MKKLRCIFLDLINASSQARFPSWANRSMPNPRKTRFKHRFDHRPALHLRGLCLRFCRFLALGQACLLAAQQAPRRSLQAQMTPKLATRWMF